MHSQNTLDSIPIDLLYEIFSRLPANTVGRCRCISKILASRLGNEDFKQLFLTRSLTRPRLLFAVERTTEEKKNEWAFYTLPQPQNRYEQSSSPVVTAVFHSKFPRFWLHEFSYESGLFNFPTRIMDDKLSRVICNPSTGQYVVLPKLRTYLIPTSFLGFDPIYKQFKLLLMNAEVKNERIHFILTLGTGKMKWRTIKCPPYSFSISNGICINGILYYIARDIGIRSDVIVCFDVRTETFKFKPIDIHVRGICPRLINYKGKLGITISRIGSGSTVELDMLVVDEEDVEKQEWSKYTLPLTFKFNPIIYVVGMTSTDEIVLSTVTSKPVFVYYFNPKRKSLQSVEVQGFENHRRVHVFMDYVEDLYVNDAEHFKSNVYAICDSDEEDDDDQVS